MSGPKPRIRSRWLALRARVMGPLLLAVLVLLSCDDADHRQPARLVGRTAPTFKLATLEHERFYLREQRGKPVVLLFWDTSCQVCKREMVALESLRNSIGPERVSMASVCADPENVDLARRMVRGLGLGYPTLLDPGGRITRQYQVQGFPTTVVITPQGSVGFAREGYTEPLIRQLQQTLEGYLDRAEHAD